MSGLGGRSPTSNVLLVPSLMSMNWTAESANNTPFLRLWRVPATPRYEPSATVTVLRARTGCWVRESVGQV